MNRLLYISILLLLGLTESLAQGPPIFTDTPVMLGLEGKGFRTFGRYISKENVKVYVQPLVLPFNLTSKWQLGGIAPFINIAPKNAGNRFGLGDIKLFTKYQIFKKDGKGKTFRTLIKLTETIPTGNTTESPALGSDSWQTALGLVNGYITLKYGIYGEIAYNFTSNDLPDNLIYNLAFAFPLLPQKYPPQQINLYLEFNGNLITDSNQNSFFISPGIQYIAGKKLLFETGIQFPLVEEVPEAIKTRFMYTLGARILLF
jgi:Putative MetA-pathway of phenol degradation